jgi:hypothetical protein
MYYEDIVKIILIYGFLYALCKAGAVRSFFFEKKERTKEKRGVQAAQRTDWQQLNIIAEIFDDKIMTVDYFMRKMKL